MGSCVEFSAFHFLRICFGFRISIFGFSLREERELAQLRRLVDSIELEIIRVLEAGNALKESPDYELHRLTTQTPAFFDETVGRHVESLERELAALESEAAALAKEIEELSGEAEIG
jgi:hypothetical protein